MSVINLNDPFTAVMTEAGAKAWNARFDSIAKRLGNKFQPPAPVAAGDTIRFQLWDAMKVFGPMICMGMPGPFEMNDITAAKP